MNRQQRKAMQREQNKLEKKLNKLDATSLKMVEVLAMQRFDEYVKLVKELLSGSTYEAMRENRVGEERANRILVRINEIMFEKSEGKA
ncbi:hypothetical protein KQI86_19510 [Clostridium sp. MSJ-11]|uniref:Phage protein n=1 Tax=Clostridium mobile TaxID=2841512 RepID=A0ABS6EMZ2_9CLOT|nr:hypothetical protein [Clostridium mobile]MBU5486492.1 hypothetical protein [Clostridium mobile]